MMQPRLTGIGRVQRRGLEALVPAQRRAGPLPDAAQPGLAGRDAVAVARHSRRVPLPEPDVGAGGAEVDEETRVLLLLPLLLLLLAVLVAVFDRTHGHLQRRRLLHAVVDEVTVGSEK